MANIDLGTLRATIKIEGADQAKKDLQDVGSKTKEVENETKTGTTSMSSWWERFSANLAALRVDKMMDKVGNAIKNTVAAVANGVSQFIGAAQESYASYEQLSGGSKLMFGEAYDFIAQQAETAAGRIQMSTNDYLTQVNGMAVGLTTALGGNAQAAAQLADKVVTAEADIVAATGQSTEAVQNAFNGVMRGNYTMLDNLGLGIKGTKEGMQEVIDQMNKWNAENGKATQYTIDNVADCQAALTDYVAYVGMAGYASNEGATTIEGATNTMKASWDNLLTSIGRSDADFNSIISNLSSSAQNYLDVMMEFADNAITNIADNLPKVLDEAIALLEKNFPKLMQLIGRVVTEIGPKLLEAIPPILAAIGNILSQVWNAISTAAAQIDWVQMLGDIGSKIMELLPLLIEALVSLVNGIVSWLGSNGPTILAAAAAFFTNLVTGLVQAIPQVVAGLVSLVQNLITTIINEGPNLLNSAIEFFLNILMACLNAIPDIVGGLVDLITQILSYIIDHGPELLTTALTFFGNILNAIITKGPEILAKIGSVVTECISKVGAGVGRMLQKGIELIGGLLSGIGQKAGEVFSWFGSLPGKILSAIGNLGSTLWSAGTDLIQGFINGITSAASGILSSVQGAIGGAVDQVKSFLGIASPSKLFKQFGEWTMEGFEIGVDANADSVADTMANVSKQFTDAFQVTPTIPDFTTPIAEMMDSYANFANKYRIVNGGKAADERSQTNITVNNYSPKALTEVETARQFRRSARALALQNIA